MDLFAYVMLIVVVLLGMGEVSVLFTAVDYLIIATRKPLGGFGRGWCYYVGS